MTDGVCVSEMRPSAGAPQDVYYLGNVPARLRNETARVQRENEERARRSLLEKVPARGSDIIAPRVLSYATRTSISKNG